MNLFTCRVDSHSVRHIEGNTGRHDVNPVDAHVVGDRNGPDTRSVRHVGHRRAVGAFASLGGLVAAALVSSTTHAGIDFSVPYVIDFFPEGLQVNNTVQLGFFGPGQVPNGGAGHFITGTRLYITFTTAAGFDAAELYVQLVAPAGNSFIFVSGESLGWSGQGTFSAELIFDDLNGEINNGIWTFDIGGTGALNAYSGTFSNDTRWEVDLSEFAPGDLDGNGIIDGADLGLLLAAWGTGDVAADLDDSGVVDGADLGALLALWFE